MVPMAKASKSPATAPPRARPKKSSAPKKPAEAAPRRRLPAEEARERILEAARTRLKECGPDGLRLQDIAADVGVAHPTVLHHFGNREGLVRALVNRTLVDLEKYLVRCFMSGDAPDNLPAMMDRVDRIMRHD